MTDIHIFVGIHSLGSPQWGEEGGVIEGGSFDPSLCQFLYALRATLRCSYATAVITMATHLFQVPHQAYYVFDYCQSLFHIAVLKDIMKVQCVQICLASVVTLLISFSAASKINSLAPCLISCTFQDLYNYLSHTIVQCF